MTFPITKLKKREREREIHPVVNSQKSFNEEEGRGPLTERKHKKVEGVILSDI